MSDNRLARRTTHLAKPAASKGPRREETHGHLREKAERLPEGSANQLTVTRTWKKNPNTSDHSNSEKNKQDKH